MSKHEMGYLWIEPLESKKARIGLSSAGLKHLGDIEWIALPAIGEVISKETPLFIVESSKAAIELESPIAGTVCTVQLCTEELVRRLVNEPDQTWLLELDLL